MSRIGFESDPDESRGEFIRYLAQRLGVSEEAALSCLGDWLTAAADDGSLARSVANNTPRRRWTKQKRGV
jgi:hypothetical protein